MKGIWKVATNYAGREKFYQVFRLRDTAEVDHSGNRQVVATMNDEDEAMRLAAMMNEREGLHIWIVDYLVRKKEEDEESLNAYTVEGCKTAVVAKRIHDAAAEGLAFAISNHHSDADNVFITDIGIAETDSGTLVGKAIEDPLADEIWPE